MDSDKRKGRAAPFILILFIALCVFVVIIMIINSKKPDTLALESQENQVKGAYFIQVNQVLIEQMAENWLPNDLFWPTVLLDNMPNFQIGQLEVVRYNVRVLRDNLSRMRTTDKLDDDAEDAFTSLSNDPFKWWFPSAESKWKLASEKLNSFYQNLLSGKSHFYPRADNLVELLSQYVSLMGGVNTRLINAPRDLNETLSMEGEKKESSGSRELVDIDIPWHEIDNNFYYAQGVAYALHESFKAIRIDFMDVLVDKNSLNLMDKILRILTEVTLSPLLFLMENLKAFSPITL